MALAAEAGLELDDWQADVLRISLGQRPDRKWSAFEVGVNVARQNGKGAILEARELAGLFLLPERMIVHSAHQFDTSLEALRRLLWLIEDNPRLEDEVKKVSRSHGNEGIELQDGSRIHFRTRTKGGGRGFSADCLVLDEAMFLPEYGYGALLPILSAMENPQVWYTGSAVDQDVHPDGVVFARVRERGMAGDDPRLAYFEWSFPYEHPEDIPEDVLLDEKAWKQANPAIGLRISAEQIGNERRALDARTFAVERLGVGDWPDTTGTEHVIDMKVWATLQESEITAEDPVCFAFDVAPDRSKASIAMAARREDGLLQIEVVTRDFGTGWLPHRLKELTESRECLKSLCDGVSPAASLLPELERLEVPVETINGGEMAQACGQFFDVVDQRRLRHPGNPELTLALEGAAKRPLSDAWAWSRKSSTIDISPLVACTIAAYGVTTSKSQAPLVAWV